MKVIDVNLWLNPPEGFNFVGVSAKGAYLQLVYSRLEADRTQLVDIFLNDQGREVLRTAETVYLPASAPKPPAPKPVGRWYRIKNGFLIALQGVQEMFK